ncbi:hypothetical protein [Arcanobacterium phocae]|uniref:hypothetical protein n=1 Tax=Arcanobacterium phocae TaxID=131112 RepID=UPI001C0EBEF1|nr:hypothetical protein [Arcanobacterium phocae]
MKKIVAGVCVLAFSIAGLAGCSQGPDKAAVKDKFYNKFVEDVPSGELSKEQINDLGHCLADGIFDQLNDQQIKEFDKVLDKEKIDKNDLPKGTEDVFLKTSNDCVKKIVMGDK